MRNAQRGSTQTPPAGTTYFEAGMAQSTFLRLMLGLSLCVNGLLGVGLVVPLLRGLPIYYIPAGGPGVSSPGVLSDGYATDFAVRWMRTRYSFTPETVQAAHKEILPTLLPSVREAFRRGAEEEARKVRTNHVTTHWTVTEATALRREGAEVLVMVKGIRSVYVKKSLIRDEDLYGMVGVMPWVGEGHERGVVISRLDLRPKTLGELGE